MKYRSVEILRKKEQLITIGLKNYINKEIKIEIIQNLEKQYKYLLKYLVDYIIDSAPNIQSGQTISYYSWLLKLELDELNYYYEVKEVKKDGSDFQLGAQEAIEIFKLQTKETVAFGVEPNFPNFGQKIVISKGVYEGLNVEGVRYESPAHMTGWWLTTDEYDENPDSLMIVHFYHVAFKRQDLMKYFALPFGFRFHQSNSDVEIWFDKDVL